MWLIYNAKTMQVLSKQFTKKSARKQLHYLRLISPHLRHFIEIDKLQIDMTMEQWRFWKILQTPNMEVL